MQAHLVIQRRMNPKLVLNTFATLIILFFVFILSSPSILQEQVFGSNTNNASNSNDIPWQLIDFNPSLYSSENKLSRIGTITDGVSKLQLLIDYNETARLTIKGNEDLRYGTINANQSQLVGESNNESSLLISPSATRDGFLINVEYTPPQSYPVMNDDRNNSYRTVGIEVRDNYTVVSNIPIRLYRVPVVLVHGVWTDSDKSWKETNFDTILINKGFSPSFADYRNYNAETFDPYANIIIGNQGIDSLRKTIKHVLNDYREHKFIAASQVDVIAHSMCGNILETYEKL
jgi:hypothetical protein